MQVHMRPSQDDAVLVEQVRSVSVDRLGPRVGKVRPRTAAAIDARLRVLFDL